MPLFDNIESDVTAFFVSQGSVFDTLVRSIMERLVHTESRVDALTSDVATNYTNVNQLVHTISAEVDAQHAGTLARLEHIEQLSISAAAAAASVTASDSSNASDNTKAEATDTGDGSTAATNHMSSHELEYYIVTLARQLHVVLELFFQPHAHDMVRDVQSKQARFATVSDVLTQNESILMQLSALDTQQQQEQQQPALEHSDDSLEHQLVAPDDDGTVLHERPSIRDAVVESITEIVDGDADDVFATPREEAAGASEYEPFFTAFTTVEVREDSSTDDTEVHEVDAAEVTTVDALLPIIAFSVDRATDGSVSSDNGEAEYTAAKLQVVTKPVAVASAGSGVALSSQRARSGPSTRPRPVSSNSRNKLLPRKKSLYDSFRDFHDQQLHEDERLQQQEQALLRKVQQLLAVAKRQWRDEAVSTMALEWQTNARALESQQLRLQTEWRAYQEQQQQSPKDVISIHEQQQQIDACLATQAQQLADVLERLSSYERDGVQRGDLDAIATAWRQAARDECVFGVTADALAALQREMETLQTQLTEQLADQLASIQQSDRSEQAAAATSQLLEALLEEVGRVLELLARVLALLAPDGAGLHGPAGAVLMQTLRTCLAALDDLAQSVESDRGASVSSAAAVAETLRQMELGTASLLDAVEAQQDRCEHAFAQHQLALAQLQSELLAQRQADDELKGQLAACPSHEDTMRFIQELREQIRTSASDSTTRMLETVDELRLRMGGLPSADVVERLAQAVQRKADRNEMDRLEKLLAASASSSSAGAGPAAPVGSLMKTPMRCLSCDQSLPYAYNSSNSALPEYQQHQHVCSHDHDGPPRPHFYYAATAEPTTSLGRDVFAPATAAARRRRQRQLQLLGLGGSGGAQLSTPWLDGATRAFVNLDDGRNRIPLRRAELSDRIVYGPAITPSAFRRRGNGAAFGRADLDFQRAAARPKTAVSPGRRANGGEVITRSVSSSVVIRPFAEQAAPAPATSRPLKR